MKILESLRFNEKMRHENKQRQKIAAVIAAKSLDGTPLGFRILAQEVGMGRVTVMRYVNECRELASALHEARRKRYKKCAV